MIEKKDPGQKIIEDESSDDDLIIELTNEITTKPEEVRKPASAINDEFRPPKVDKDLSFSDDEQPEDHKVMGKPSEASSTSGQDDNGIDMLADIEFEHEAGQEFIPLAELDDNDAERDDDIIEIKKFDRHYPDDDEETLEHASLLDPSDLEDKDFIELFDIEEEDPLQDEEMRELSESEEKAVEAELSRFFDDELEDESEIEKNAGRPVDKFSERDPDLDVSRAAAALSSKAGKIGRSATRFPQDPASVNEAASLAKDHSEMSERMPADLAAAGAGNSPIVSAEQIEQTIERIINEKLAGRVEHIIYEIIEKAVIKEIERLKSSLLGDSPPEDNR
jgi:hypothetical protein